MSTENEEKILNNLKKSLFLQESKSFALGEIDHSRKIAQHNNILGEKREYIMPKENSFSENKLNQYIDDLVQAKKIRLAEKKQQHNPLKETQHKKSL